MASFAEAQEAKGAVMEMVQGSPAVNGVGIASDDRGFVVKVNLNGTFGDVDLPETVNGVPVILEVTGPVRKQA